MKVAIGVDRHNQILPIGTYTDKTWQEIAEEWRSQQVSFPSGSVLIADGGVGLADSLAAYRAKCGMFGYVRRWLRFGIACPEASSMIEGVMRELGRRLKRIAYGWSARGAAKMARIILKKFTQQEEWDAYWKEKTKTQIPHFFIRFDGRLIVTSDELVKS